MNKKLVRWIGGLPEVDLGVRGQNGPDLYQDVDAAPGVGHFILIRQNKADKTSV